MNASQTRREDDGTPFRPHPRWWCCDDGDYERRMKNERKMFVLSSYASFHSMHIFQPVRWGYSGEQKTAAAEKSFEIYSHRMKIKSSSVEERRRLRKPEWVTAISFSSTCRHDEFANELRKKVAGKFFSNVHVAIPSWKCVDTLLTVPKRSASDNELLRINKNSVILKVAFSVFPLTIFLPNQQLHIVVDCFLCRENSQEKVSQSNIALNISFKCCVCVAGAMKMFREQAK